MLRIQRFSGNRIQPYIGDLARLRITVFREFPYLYDGDERYESKYLRRYLTSDETVVAIAFDGDKVVGASTGMPMRDEDIAIRKPFEKAGYDISDIFYFGESVLLSGYRGQGAGVAFFKEREAHALKNGYSITTFCAVNRSEDHPRRPVDYQPLDAFWKKRGYKKHPELVSTFTWQDLDETAEAPKQLTYWLKYHA
ncbi:MAG: GNAT family N-acetyltransferase [Bacteroidetes bacterium]|nr:GNAT family N-acetyltransferase [Bacteroidota bacterium]